MPKKKMSNNQVLLKEIINQEFNEHKNSFPDADSYFEYFSAQQYLKSKQLSDEEIMNGLVGGGNDGGYDGIYIFINNLLLSENIIDAVNITKSSELKLILIQSKNECGFGEEAINKWKTSAKNLLNMDNKTKKYKSRYEENIINKFDMFKELIKKGIRLSITIQIEFVYITLGNQIHKNIQEQGEELVSDIKKMFPAAIVDVKFITCDDLMNDYNCSNDENLTLQFAELPISAGENTDYIALVKLAEYYKLISDDDKIKLSLFDMNVRDYQGNNQVNDSIFESLKNDGDEEFWWLNNGITILAEKIVPTTSKNYSMLNPKIVNGMQTSFEIFRYFNFNKEKLSTDKRNVLVRIIAPKSELSRDKIIFSTNNQTNISKSLLRATDSIQIQIEQYFKNHNLYYDRRKNYYKNQGKNSEEIISMTFLAQCMITLFKKEPDNARMRPSNIINDNKQYSELYNSSIDLSIYYKVAFIGKLLREKVNCDKALSKTDKSNVLFYLMYAIVNNLCNADITFNSVSQIDLNNLTDEYITKIYKKVIKVYKKNCKQSKISDWRAFFDEIIKI